MNHLEMVYDAVYKGAIKEGCGELISKNAALSATNKFKTNRFTTVSKMIKQEVSEAKKLKGKKKR